jgi:hypothetical protein
MKSALPSWLRYRRVGVFVALGALVANAGFALGACSSSSTDTTSGEGGASGDSGGKGDAGGDGLAPPPPGDSGKPGNCSAVKGACDIVSQNCPMGQECVVVNGPMTQCVPAQASQQLDKGRACCPPSMLSPGNPCLPGLSCIGSPCTDGGPQTGRCAPACCKGDDTACGMSQPEGIAGACNLTIVDSQQNELYQTCSYQERCIPFGVQACKPGEACLITDKLGSSGCLASSGKQNGQACGFANDCADGLLCLTVGDAGVCHYECLTPGSITPFDAGGLDGAPGYGGCPMGQACQPLDPKSAPAWLSVCN